MRRAFVTGAAGFIGSNLVDGLLEKGYAVTGWDNLVTGRLEFLEKAFKNSRFRLIKGDTLDLTSLQKGMSGSDLVLHLAANADVRFGIEHPSKDFDQNTRATFHVLEAMRLNNVRSLGFASTGSVYGEANVIPTPEDVAFPIQTSLYGASKLAGEAMIQAYCEGFGMEAFIFRFVSILGPRYTHGHVIDFCNQLRKHPDRLHVLGDGTQRKSYLYVQDCVNAILTAIQSDAAASARHRVAVFNLGTNSYCELRDSISWICEKLGVSPHLHFSGGSRGWIGDNPFIYLATDRIRQLGWTPQLTIRQSVETTVAWLMANPWVFECIKLPANATLPSEVPALERGQQV